MQFFKEAGESYEGVFLGFSLSQLWLAKFFFPVNLLAQPSKVRILHSPKSETPSKTGGLNS